MSAVPGWNALDDAFPVAVREAMRRGSALFMREESLAIAKDHAQRITTWTAHYPPASVTAHTIVDWLAGIGITPGDGDLFFPRENLERAARDLGIA